MTRWVRVPTALQMPRTIQVPAPSTGSMRDAPSMARSRSCLSSPRRFSGFLPHSRILTERRRWFRIPGNSPDASHELDFRVGGCELARGTFAAAGVAEHIEVRAQFLDIVDQQRIVYVHELLLDGHRRSVSLVTIELCPRGPGTQLIYTEQYVILLLTGDGSDDVAERKGGTRLLMNGLAAALRA